MIGGIWKICECSRLGEWRDSRISLHCISIFYFGSFNIESYISLSIFEHFALVKLVSVLNCLGCLSTLYVVWFKGVFRICTTLSEHLIV